MRPDKKGEGALPPWSQSRHSSVRNCILLSRGNFPFSIGNINVPLIVAVAKSRPARQCHRVSRRRIMKRRGRAQTLSSELPLAISLHSFLCTSCTCFPTDCMQPNINIYWFLDNSTNFSYQDRALTYKNCIRFTSKFTRYLLVETR